MATFLGIDAGTSGCRCCVIDADGVPLAWSSRVLAPPVRRGNASEQDPQSWWNALTESLDDLRTYTDLSDIEAVCIDATSSTLLLCDAAGKPRTPALMYNDARATTEAATISRMAPPESAAHGPGASLAKLLWLLDTPDAGQACRALHQADWLTGCLSGRFDISDENNALKLGYDPVQRRWPDWLGPLDLPAGMLPAVVPAGQTIGQLTAESCQRWGFSPGTRMVSGTTDSTASTIATGAGPGDAVTTLGSTLVLKVFAERPVFAPAAGVYSHRLGDHWLAGGASNTGGAVLQQFFSEAEISRYSKQLRPDHPTGLDYYPLPAPGERFPVNDPGLQPRLSPRPADDVQFFQAILEGITAVEVRGYRLLAELGAPLPSRILSAGGGAANTAWRVMREHALGVPVIAARQQEAAYGAAQLALRSTPLPEQQGGPAN